MSTIDQLTAKALQQIADAGNLDALDALRVALLGKSGEITLQLKQLGALAADERKSAGEAINRAKDAVAEAIAVRKLQLEQAALDRRLASERIDVTQPGRGLLPANAHPVSKTLERISEIFSRLGYQTAEGPEVEDDWHNFEALNIPADHPARAMHDTFYFPDGRLLRTHTSPVQVRAMLRAVALP